MLTGCIKALGMHLPNSPYLPETLWVGIGDVTSNSLHSISDAVQRSDRHESSNGRRKST